MSKHLTEKQTKLASEIDAIVASRPLPDHHAIGLLSSTVLFTTSQCEFCKFVDSIANIRLCLSEDFDCASAALAAWLDDANTVLDL